MCSDSTRCRTDAAKPSRMRAVARPRLYRDRGGPCIRRRLGRSCTATIAWRSRAMFVATIVDATDGMLARRARVKEVLPDVDGARIDDIVDYITFVFLPMLLLEAAGGLYASVALPVIAIVLLSSMYGFVAPDAKSSDHFFTGLPVVLEHRRLVSDALPRAAVLQRAGAARAQRARLRPDRLRLPVADADAAHADAGARVRLGRAARPRSSGCGRRRRAGSAIASLAFPVYYTVLSLVLHARRRPAAVPVPAR